MNPPTENSPAEAASVVCVGLNPAIDRVIEVRNFRPGEHQSGKEVMRSPGGKALNVSRALSALGVANVLTGFLGAENRGEFDPLLNDPRVRDEFFSLPGRTRENVTIADPEAGQDTHIRDTGLAVSAAGLQRLANKLKLLGGEGDMVLFSGSLPPGIGPKAFAELVAGCIQRGARVAVDTSGNASKAVADLPLWAVKPNHRELPALIGRSVETPAQQLAAAGELAQRFDNVLLSCGADGAYLFRRDQALRGRLDVKPDRVRNTVGCGDAMLAGFVAGIVAGRDPREAFADALAAATASAMTFGPAQIDPEVFAELRPRVELTSAR